MMISFRVGCESFLEGPHDDRAHVNTDNHDHPAVTPPYGTLLLERATRHRWGLKSATVSVQPSRAPGFLTHTSNPHPNHVQSRRPISAYEHSAEPRPNILLLILNCGTT